MGRNRRKAKAKAKGPAKAKAKVKVSYSHEISREGFQCRCTGEKSERFSYKSDHKGAAKKLAEKVKAEKRAKARAPKHVVSHIPCAGIGAMSSVKLRPIVWARALSPGLVPRHVQEARLAHPQHIF